MFTAVLSSARKRDLKSECFMIARFMALIWTSPWARETRDDPIGERKETLMSRRARRRERPQSKAKAVKDCFKEKWYREGTSVEDSLAELMDYFSAHKSEMKIILTVEGSCCFRFIGDEKYFFFFIPTEEGAVIGTAVGPRAASYDNDEADIIDETRGNPPKIFEAIPKLGKVRAV